MKLVLKNLIRSKKNIYNLFWYNAAYTVNSMTR